MRKDERNGGRSELKRGKGIERGTQGDKKRKDKN